MSRGTGDRRRWDTARDPISIHQRPYELREWRVSATVGLLSVPEGGGSCMGGRSFQRRGPLHQCYGRCLECVVRCAERLLSSSPTPTTTTGPPRRELDGMTVDEAIGGGVRRRHSLRRKSDAAQLPSRPPGTTTSRRASFPTISVITSESSGVDRVDVLYWSSGVESAASHWGAPQRGAKHVSNGDGRLGPHQHRRLRVHLSGG